MADAYFKYTSVGPMVPYKLGYLTNGLAWADLNFIKTSGYWYDATGTLFPAGSVAGIQIQNDKAEGPSLGLSNQ